MSTQVNMQWAGNAYEKGLRYDELWVNVGWNTPNNWRFPLELPDKLQNRGISMQQWRNMAQELDNAARNNCCPASNIQEVECWMFLIAGSFFCCMCCVVGICAYPRYLQIKAMAENYQDALQEVINKYNFPGNPRVRLIESSSAKNRETLCLGYNIIFKLTTMPHIEEPSTGEVNASSTSIHQSATAPPSYASDDNPPAYISNDSPPAYAPNNAPPDISKNASPSSDSWVEDLRKLKELKDQGIITEEEFSQSKAGILAQRTGMPVNTQPMHTTSTQTNKRNDFGSSNRNYHENNNHNNNNGYYSNSSGGGYSADYNSSGGGYGSSDGVGYSSYGGYGDDGGDGGD